MLFLTLLVLGYLVHAEKGKDRLGSQVTVLRNVVLFTTGVLCLLLAARRLVFLTAVLACTVGVYVLRPKQLSDRKSGRATLILGVGVSLVVAFMLMSYVSHVMDTPHQQYILSIPEYIGERTEKMYEGNASTVGWDVLVLGRGLGCNSLGSKYATDHASVDYNAHGGPGAILNEMGGIGLLAYLWLWAALYIPGCRLVWRFRTNAYRWRIAFGLYAWMLCWLANFIQTHGILGDGMSAISYYFSCGLLLGMARYDGSARPICRSIHC
jgi:hypothetical protein